MLPATRSTRSFPQIPYHVCAVCIRTASKHALSSRGYDLAPPREARCTCDFHKTLQRFTRCDTPQHPTPRVALSGVHTTCFEQWDSDICPLLTRMGCQSVFGRPIRAPYDSLSCLRAPRTYVCTRTGHLHAVAAMRRRCCTVHPPGTELT